MSQEDKDPSVQNPEDLEKEEGDDLDLDKEEEEDLEDDEDLDKPLTKKDLIEFRKQQESLINNRFANKRHESKQAKNYPKDSDKSRDDPYGSRLQAIEISNAKRDYGYQNNLSPAEVDLVFKFANGKPTAKTLEHPFVKGGLENLRTSNNLKDNLSKGSGASTFEVEGKKWDDLKPEEKQANFGARQKAILSNKK